MTAGDSHLFGGASSGAWCIDGILCCKNKILGSEFGGYTAHHPISFKDVPSWKLAADPTGDRVQAIGGAVDLAL